ncbi:MAG: AMP phosphorylase [Candidatus Aenigmatarchaeota archaeon]
MKFRAKPISFEAGGKGVVILNKADVETLGIHVLDRVFITKDKKTLIAIVDVTEKFAEQGVAVTNSELNKFFKLKLGDEIEIVPAEAPESVKFVKQKITGARLDASKIRAIVQDVVERHLSEIELSAFVSALEIYGLSMDEAEGLSNAMVETGKQFTIPGRVICDKHSIGGVPGDKTSLIGVPIIAAAGLTIPKTSSRAITSAAGTADRMEVLAPVDLSIDEIKKVVKKTNGCLVWGGSLELAPADDVFIQVEYPLGVDPLLLPSIMSKKRAVNARYVIIDIPTGRGAKIKTTGSAYSLASDFRELGRRMGMEVACTITFGEQPIGKAIGPALEAREALQTLEGKGPPDLIEKVTQVVGTLFDLVGKNRIEGKKHAMNILKNKKALRKMREIIGEQGGNPKIKASDIKLGKKNVSVRSKKSGKVLWMKNAEIAAIAREAGTPKDKGAGILFNKKIGDSVKKGEKTLTIYAENTRKLNNALKMVGEMEPVIVDKRIENRMLTGIFPTEIPHRRIFMLER